MELVIGKEYIYEKEVYSASEPLHERYIVKLMHKNTSTVGSDYYYFDILRKLKSTLKESKLVLTPTQCLFYIQQKDSTSFDSLFYD